ncbi:MAG: V-type ATP synthase subunit E [Pyramidobacter sp.]
MALADIRKKIEQDAADEAAKLLDDARKQAEALNKDADAQIAQNKKYYDDLFETEAPEVRRRAEIIANLDVKKIKLGAKRELIEQSFRQAFERLCKLSDDKYLAFMEKLLDQAVSSGDEELLVSGKEKRMNKSWLDKYNAAKGRKLTLSAEKADIEAGFILRRGRISVNCSLDTLVRWLEDDLESDVVKRLFDAE